MRWYVTVLNAAARQTVIANVAKVLGIATRGSSSVSSCRECNRQLQLYMPSTEDLIDVLIAVPL